MKKLNERSHWENEWADAFNDEKQTPSERVWQNIDSVLANKEAKKYKKRALFYKWLAAASVFISACGAVLFMLSNPQNSPSGMAETSAVELQESEQLPPKSSSGGPVVVEEALPAGNENTSPASAPEGNPRANSHAAESRPGKATAGNNMLAQENAEGTGSGSNAGPAGRGPAGNAQADREPAPDGIAENQVASATGPEKQPVPEKEASGSAKSFAFSLEEEGKGLQERNGTLAGSTPVDRNELPDDSVIPENADNTSGFTFLKAQKKGPILEENQQAPVDIYVSKVWMPSDLLKNKPEQDTERFWVGASLASNSFKPNFEDNSPAPVMMAESNFKPDVRSRLSAVNIDTWDKSQESMISFAGGLQGAARLGEKWVLQGGLQYGTYKTSGNAGAYTDASGTHTYPLHYSNFSPEKASRSVNNLSDAGQNFYNSVVMNSAPVSAINTFEFLSVPVTIGYVVLDKKVGVVLSPGVSSEFFLSNQLSAKKDELVDYSVSGSDSPYNIIHLRGLLGASVFYKLGENYIISVEPAYQHAITDFNKSGSFFDSRPSNISLGVAFKYIIR